MSFSREVQVLNLKIVALNNYFRLFLTVVHRVVFESLLTYLVVRF